MTLELFRLRGSLQSASGTACSVQVQNKRLILLYRRQRHQPVDLHGLSSSGRWFKPRLAPLSFSKFLFEITFEIGHELYRVGKHREETCT